MHILIIVSLWLGIHSIQCSGFQAFPGGRAGRLYGHHGSPYWRHDYRGLGQGWPPLAAWPLYKGYFCGRRFLSPAGPLAAAQTAIAAAGTALGWAARLSVVPWRVLSSPQLQGPEWPTPAGPICWLACLFGRHRPGTPEALWPRPWWRGRSVGPRRRLRCLPRPLLSVPEGRIQQNQRSLEW
jgi:hypothetical protein